MQALEAKIKAKGITKGHLAKKAGIAPATLSRILSGKQGYVSESLISKINDYLDSLNS